MKHEDFSSDKPGGLVEILDHLGNPGLAFLPHDLPPDISLSSAIWKQSESAAFALGNLNGLGSRLPNPAMIVQPFIRKEALASSRIEGTRAEFGQLALFEADSGLEDERDVREVVNYVRALEDAWGSEIPAISVAGISSIHETLLRGVRGSHLRPGQLRTVPVLIGAPGDSISSARFVPTPPEYVHSKLQNMVAYARSQDPVPRLVQLAILHYQFETIHPFNDGNGRVGRLLIPLQLHEWGQLDHPLLYISEYFERHRDQYIDRLYGVSVRGAWEEWITFFLHALERQSRAAYVRAESLLNLQAGMRSHYQLQGRPRMLQLIDELFVRGTMTYGLAQNLTGLGKQAANSLVRKLVDDGVLVEVTGRSRNQIFYAPEIARASMGISEE